MINKRLFSFSICLLLSCTKEKVIDITDTKTLNDVIESDFKQSRIPGMAYVAIKNNVNVYIGSKGFANVNEQKAFTTQTRMQIASVSKTIIATAIMQLYEQGKIDLNADINNYLPFQVNNPNYPSTRITTKMLLTHTSSISDKGYVNATMYLFGYVDYPQSQSAFLNEYLLAGGQYFTNKSFSNSKPGETYEYSNIGSSLLAVIVEKVTNKNFNNYCNQYIFQPLGMTKTTWLYSETPKAEVAILYHDVNNLNPKNPFYSYPDYANGHLLTTIEDLSKFLRAYIMNGSFNSFQLLKPQTITEMLQPYLITGGSKQGYIFGTTTTGNKEVWGHDGADLGISTGLYFDPIAKTGFIVFANRAWAYPQATYSALLKFANK